MTSNTAPIPTKSMSPFTAELLTGTRNDERPTQRSWWYLTIAAVAIPALVYLLFVAHYARNGIYWDDWSFVPIVNGALHHHLSMSELWQQHNENRLLVPYLFVAFVGYFTHLNTLVLIYLNVVIFTASFILILTVYPRYAGMRTAPIQTLLLGIVWFSVLDIENELWAFQVGWYLVVLFLAILLFIMARRDLSLGIVVTGAVVCVLGSFSSLQGLLLWPVGLLCLIWRVRTGAALIRALTTWIAAAIATTYIYFRGFNFNPGGTGGGSVSYAEHHLHETLTYILLLVGNVFPTTSPQVELHKVIGLIILLVAVFVITSSVMTWRTSTSIPLPLCLVVFGVMYDVSIAFGRVSVGFAGAASSRYSMPNLLILTGFACFVFARPTKTSVPAHPKSGHLAGMRILTTLVVASVVSGLTVLSWYSGTHGAREWRARVEAGDSVMVNFQTIPEPSRTIQFNNLVFPNLAAATQMHWIQMVETEKLGELNSGTASQYEHHSAG